MTGCSLEPEIRGIPTATEGGELIQHIPAHGVDRRGGQGQTRLHMAVGAYADVGGAAGLGKAQAQHIGGQLLYPGHFGDGATDFADPAFRVGDHQGTALAADHGGKGDAHQAVFRALIALPGLFDPCGIITLVGTDAEHGLSDVLPVVAVGEALTIEGSEQLIHLIGGDEACVDGLPVDPGDGGYVLCPLHAALQLQGCNAHFLQILQVMHQTVVLQAQGEVVFPAAVAVALTAGLGTAAPVAGPTADGGGQVALSGIAHAQRTVGEHLDLDGGILADVGDLIPAQLPAQHHPAHAPSRAQQHAGQAVDGHLGGAVDGNVGCDLSAQLHHAQILHDESVHIALGRLTDQVDQGRGFLVGNQSI